MTVFLVRLKDDGDGWRPIDASPTYYGQSVVSGTWAASGEEPLFVASANQDHCRIEWVASSRTSPLPGEVSRLDMAHGDTLAIDSKRWLVYVEPDSLEWTASEPVCQELAWAEALAHLRRLPAPDLADAASRFLSLPCASAWWQTEFASRTGFEQCRDGRVPAVRTCDVLLRERGAELRWRVEIKDLFGGTWTNRPERAAFTRPVFAEHLLMLRDCATVLAPLATGR